MLIELEELKHKINNSKYYGTDAWRDILDMAVDCDSKSRPQGHWIIDGCIEMCDQCGEPRDFPHWKYCPNCGARMKGADDES